MAHTRRRIYYAESNNKQLSSYALSEITKLYAIEQACKDEQLNIDQRKARRQKESVPILKALGEWMKEKYKQLRPNPLSLKHLHIALRDGKS
nr:IS66 family transposase [Chitinophaga silvisoli]